MNSKTGDVPPLEVWGGIECTINRVGDTYFEQLHRSGHFARPGDLDRFADLGIKAIRYPVLWEQIAPNGLDNANWSWSDGQLQRLRELNIRPIVGLVHHGSGPRDTHLNDPTFPERLATFAEAVAQRYPWIEDYTPVNEPLTTARFSSLYGHWYPHKRDDNSFARALLGQAKAVVLAMQRIREVNPEARLIQTDDLGRTYASSNLQYQADFENERRWLTFDLLTGGLTAERPMWSWLHHCGIWTAELEWFHANRCIPNVMGINTYLSSERFIDDDVGSYPWEQTGSNGKHSYVDVLAARVLPDGILGTQGLLAEAWERYGLPLAITEVHNGATREEQVRWLDEVWRGALTAKQNGADVRAVTVWALLGLYDWPSLVTRFDNIYEPGVFDVRGAAPRPTAIAHMVRDLATHGEHRHPILDVPGWWRRPDRFYHAAPPELGVRELSTLDPASRPANARPLLLIGSRSDLRSAMEATLKRRAIPFDVLERDALACDQVEIATTITECRAWAVMDTDLGGMTRIGRTSGASNSTFEAAHSLTLASACADRQLPMVCFIADDFDAGVDASNACNLDSTKPSVVNHSWMPAEYEVLRTHSQTLIIRTTCPEALNAGAKPVGGTAVADGRRRSEFNTNLGLAHVEGVAEATVDMLLDGVIGVWRLAGDDRQSSAGAMQWIPEEIRKLEALGSPALRMPWPARPPNSAAAG